MDDPKIPIFGAGTFLRKKGHPGPAELAPLQGLPGIQRHPDFQARLTRSRGRRKWESWLASHRLLGSTSGPTSDESATTGVRGMVRVGLSRRSTLKAGSLLLDRYGRRLRGASRDSSLNKMGFGAVPLTARFGESRGERTKRAKAFVSCEVLSFVGVSGFALTRLQNLVSGVWLKRQVSVAAEASGRGLVVGGSNCQRRKD